MEYICWAKIAKLQNIHKRKCDTKTEGTEKPLNWDSSQFMNHSQVISNKQRCMEPYTRKIPIHWVACVGVCQPAAQQGWSCLFGHGACSLFLSWKTDTVMGVRNGKGKRNTHKFCHHASVDQMGTPYKVQCCWTQFICDLSSLTSLQHLSFSLFWSRQIIWGRKISTGRKIMPHAGFYKSNTLQASDEK